MPPAKGAKPCQASRESPLLIGIYEAIRALVTFQQVYGHVVLAAARRAESGRSFVAVVIHLRGYPLPGLIVDRNVNFLGRFHRSHREPVLIAGVKVDCDQSVLV